MGHWREFEFVVVNDDFERALGELQAIVQGQGEPSRSDRAGLAELAEADGGVTGSRLAVSGSPLAACRLLRRSPASQPGERSSLRPAEPAQASPLRPCSTG